MEIHLADKIIVDILIRLPVRSLLRFKCVSKFWRILISDPYFKMKHLIHARNNENSQKLLISQFYLGMDHSFSFYCSSLLVKDVQKLDCPLNIEQVILRIFCCYDGLSIVGVGDCSSEEFKFFLWNPSTRESIELPVPELLPRKGYCTWGLGYDSTSDDYKILKIDKEVHSEILALKSGSWETIYRHPPGISFVAWGTESLSFLHGAFHWLGKSLNYSVVSFSISNKVYGEIPLPDQMFLICDADEMEYGVSVLRGMLCCYSTSYFLGKDGTFKLWVLKDYDVKESWYPMAIITCTGPSQCRPKYWIAEHEFLLFSRYGVDIVVLYLGHPTNHLDYNLVSKPFVKDLYTQKA